MGTRHLLININDIEIYEDNPRFVKAGNQIEAISRLVLDEKGKKELATLAESILLHGQNPLESIGVIRDESDDKYIAVEGNRRVLAIKLYSNPDLGHDNPSTVNSFKALRRKYDGKGVSMIENVDCCVFDSIEDIDLWITLKHTGQNNGAGVVGWNRIQALRQAIKDGRTLPDRGFLLVEWLESIGRLGDVGIETYEDVKNTTNLIRLLNDAAVLKIIGLSYDRDNLISSDNEELTIKFVARFIKDLNDGHLPVTKIYSAEDRRKYIANLMVEFGIEMGLAKDDNVPKDDFSNSSVSEGSDKSSTPKEDSSFYPESVSTPMGDVSHPTPSVPNYFTRNKFVKGNLGKLVGITESKASQIYREFKSINCNDMPVAATFLLRAIIEESGKCFVKNSMKRPYRYQELSNLSNLISICKNHIRDTCTDFTRKQHADRIFVEGEKGRVKIDEMERLNEAVHGVNIIHDKEILFSIWDKFQPFIQDLWDIINERNKAVD